MSKIFKVISLVILLMVTTMPFAGYSNPHQEKSVSETYDPVPAVMHHIADAHDWHFFDYKDKEGHEHPVSIPLPVIVYTNGHRRRSIQEKR